MKREFFVVLALLAMTACSRSESPPSAPPPAAEPAAPAPAKAEPSFVNKVWTVAESKQVALGETRVFMSDGTLAMTSPNSTPAFGTWRYEEGRLTITEEGRDYPTDILELTETAFRIRMKSPGEPVEILFTPAEQVQPAAVVSAKQAEPAPAPIARTDEQAVEDAAPLDATPSVLLGTAWRLESVGGVAALGGAQATLEFPSDGRANGNGSCNRFNGVVTFEGSTIQFGGIAATRKACPDAVMRQEEAYFAALHGAESFEVDEQSLRIFTKGQSEPLRFVAMRASAAPAANQISRAPAAAAPAPALTGIWTIVGHHNPEVSALSDNEARAHYGETVRLTASAAISSGNRCSEPGYAARNEPAASWLASEYKLAAGSLKPFAGRSQIRVMEVLCGGARWAALGARLLEIDRDRALAPWDGVFFQLARDRDFRAVGQEPGWQLEIRHGAEMRFTYDYGKGSAVTPAARVMVDSSTGTRTYHAVAEANDLRVEIVPVSCTDVMSGRPFAATVSVTLNGRTFRGCGEELATPYQG